MQQENYLKLKDKTVFIFDLDGTLYLNDKIFPGAKELLETLIKKNRNVFFITNNSSKTKSVYINKLRELFGDWVDGNQIITSLDITVDELKRKGIKKLYALAVPEVKKELEERGFEMSENPEAILVCFDKSFTYETMKTACQKIILGTPYYATHADVLCPMPIAPIPDAGAIIAYIKEATQKEPSEVFGKPNPKIVDVALKRANATKEQVVMVGDRLNTDMLMAKNASITGIWINREKVENKTQIIPNYVVDNIAELVKLI